MSFQVWYDDTDQPPRFAMLLLPRLSASDALAEWPVQQTKSNSRGRSCIRGVHELHFPNPLDLAQLKLLETSSASTTSATSSKPSSAASTPTSWPTSSSSSSSSVSRLLSSFVFRFGRVVNQQSIERQRVWQNVVSYGRAANIDGVESDRITASRSHLDSTESSVHLW